MRLTETNTGLAILAAVMLAETVWAQSRPSGTAAFRFVNRSGADIHIRATGGFEREFLVDDGDVVLQEVEPGSVTEIAYWPPWSDGYRESRENPCRLTLRAPVAGVTNDVALTLVCRFSRPLPGRAAASLRFYGWRADVPFGQMPKIHVQMVPRKIKAVMDLDRKLDAG